jgi:hypothetical protein
VLRSRPAAPRSRRLLRLALLLALAPCAAALGGCALRAAPVRIPLHTETWAYDDGCNGGAGAAPALVRGWVTFAETNCAGWTRRRPGKAMRDCHARRLSYCLVMEYLNADVIYRDTMPPGFSPRAAPESWFLHDPAPEQAYRLVAPAAEYGGGWAMNPQSRGYQTWLRGYVNTHFPGVDGLFMDAEQAALPFSGLSTGSSQEIGSTAHLQAAHAAMAAALRGPDGRPYPQVDNTIPDCGNPYEPGLGIGPGGNMLRRPVIGLLAEDCPESYGSLSPYYPDLLDDIAYITNATRGFTVLLPYGTAGAPYQDQSRRVSEATVLLAYAPGRVVIWPELEQGSARLSIWPEEGIYPTAPLQSMARPSGRGCLVARSGVPCPRGGHNDLQVLAATCPIDGGHYPCGVFRREFGACYDRARSIGGCAAIINDTSQSVTVERSWLTRSYTSIITLRGGDVQSGGTIDPRGGLFVPGLTQIPAGDALLLAHGAA